ncbi:MAG TPA: hypothetical protein VMV10_23615 [Pirellulales bacterium]|nr:hypothetical protein [Pirellulales bacterium]
MATTADRIDKAAKRRRGGVDLISLETYLAAEPFSAQRPDTLVVYCSDGRWHEQIEEFVRAQCSERADVYAAPGGPAGFSLWGSTLGEAKVCEQAIRFLREHHQLESAWLIAHEGCAYYRTKYGPLEAGYIRRRQFEDLDRARDAILRWYPNLVVRKVYAFLKADCVAFARLPD